jgi:hypothetical protein
VTGDRCAGEIAASNGGGEATARLLAGMPELAAVFTTGDNAYPDGTDANYASYYPAHVGPP